MGIYASHTVSSVTGTGNKTLNVAETISLVNVYANMYFIYGNKKYIIESNTTTSITLATGSYDNLTGAVISVYRPSDYFFIDATTGEYEDIKAALAISLSSTDVKLTTTQLNYFFPTIEGIIHDEIKRANNEAYIQTEIGHETIKSIIIDFATR
jgi:hypothetical protein